MGRIETGSVHGRFQPFHNGHLDYVLQAFDRAEKIKIGLTQIFRPRDRVGDLSRDRISSNPLAYWERAKLIEAALHDSGVVRERFEFIPFPIEFPERISEFLPNSVTCFTTVVSPWNEEKIARLEAEHYPVSKLEVSLPDNNRVTSGSEIRKLIRENDVSWVRYVPPIVSELIRDNFLQRF